MLGYHRGPLFFSCRGLDSSHNTSKVTKAEGKQIRGRGLNRFIKHSRAPEVVPGVAESGDDGAANEEDDGDVVDVAYDRLPGDAGVYRFRRRAFSFLDITLPRGGAPGLEEFTVLLRTARTHGRKRSFTRRWEEVTNEGGVKQRFARANLLFSFVRSSRAAIGNDFRSFRRPQDFHFRTVLQSLNVNSARTRPFYSYYHR